MTREVFDSIRSQACIICHRPPRSDACHIRSQKAGGPDEEWNLFPACRRCHQTQHRIGIVTFYKKFKAVKAYFESKGWTLESRVGQEKLWHPNLAIEKKDSCI